METVLDALVPMPGRENIRRSGIEIEGAGRGQLLANALHAAGLTQYDEILGYHGSRALAATQYYSVERDSTVDWEIVSPVIMLNDPASVTRLNGVLDVLRQQIKDGQVGFDMRCGLHIHVEARPCSVIGAFNLAAVWNHLEDTLFRLGSAKWERHRAADGGSSYTRPIPKQFNNVREFGVEIGDNPDRYHALSFANFFGRLFGNCHCGAVRYDSWENCTCDLGKFTFEFRVFNTTANKTKMHAYLALCQALVAYATSKPEAVDRAEFPTFAFNEHTLKTLNDRNYMTEAMYDEWLVDSMERLTWIFTQLPLTSEERDSLLYCVKNSDLSSVGSEFISSLTPTIEEVVA